MNRTYLSFFLLLIVCTATSAQDAGWQTFYEKSGMLETPSYQATVAYCRQLAAGSKMVTFEAFGKSARGNGGEVPYEPVGIGRISEVLVAVVLVEHGAPGKARERLLH